ncbi:MAG: glycosyltransferase family 9 protein [Candidatus Omnitrophota bacterium]
MKKERILLTDCQKIKRILVTRMQGLGDAVCFIPTLRILRESFPQAEITVLSGRLPAKELFEVCPFVNKVIFYDVDKERNFFDKLNFIKYLRRQRFDISVASSYEVGFALKAFLSGAKYRIGFSQHVCNGTIARDFFSFLNTVSLVSQGNENEIDVNMRLLGALGIEGKECKLDLWVNEQDKLFAGELFRQHALTDKKVLAIHPSSNNESRNWPLEKYAQLITYVLRHYEVKIVLVGSQAHYDLNEKLCALVGGGITNIAGKTALSQLMEVLRGCVLFIGNDSGPRHIAVAMGLPAIILFGPTIYKQVRPYTENCIGISKHLSCSPCDQHNCACARCMQLITVQEVIVAAEYFLDKIGIKKIDS